MFLLYLPPIHSKQIDAVILYDIFLIPIAQYFDGSILTTRGGVKRKLGGHVVIPSSTAYKDFVEIVQNLPDYDKPAFFGLPANIERSSQRMISQVKCPNVRRCQLFNH